MRRPVSNALLAVALAVASGKAAAHSAHEHGIADLLVAVEDGTVTVELVSPAANLLGFEYAPRTEAQWQSAAALIKTLEDAELIRALHSAGVCQRASWYWETALFDAESLAARQADPATDDHHAEHHHDAGHSHAGHADITVGYTFNCPGDPASLDHTLFQTFEGLEELRVSVATGDGQRGTRQRRGQPVGINV